MRSAGDLAAMDPQSWIDAYLVEQARLTAVDRFALTHDAGEVPAQAQYYRDLIPNERPGTGQQYAFEVDLDRCTGCKACVTGCHNRNGLDEGEMWRSVGLLQGGTAAAPVLQTVTTACHHCVEPACLQGCPALAYDKDPATGIVRHLDDQCIGCQYCVMKCPYDVPKYSPQRGIVRKCDMCTDRLAQGEAPACVQSCPNEAIRIVVVDRADIPANAAANFAAVAGAPDTSHTLPSTAFRTNRPLPANLRPVDTERLAPQDAHLPLVVMLVFTQASVGLLFAGLVAARASAQPSMLLADAAVLLATLGMAVALLHLGRPQYAFRAILGLRTSWLSRELLAFGVFLPMAGSYAIGRHWSLPSPTLAMLGWAALTVGVAGVLCSAMVYIDTPRLVGATRRTAYRFLLTAFAAAAGAGAFAETFGGTRTHAVGFAIAFGLTMTIKLVLEFGWLTHLRDSQMTPLHGTATLIVRHLRRATGARLVLASVVATAIASVVGASAGQATGLTALTCIGFAAFLSGECCERFLFFAAVVPPRMPGGAVT